MARQFGAAFTLAVILTAIPVLAHHTAAGMYRRGVRPENFVKPGDAIRMTVCVAKDGSHTSAAHSITVPSTLQNKVGSC